MSDRREPNPELAETATLTEWRLLALEDAVKTLAEAVRSLKELATVARTYARIGIAVLIVFVGIVQPVIVALLVTKLGD